MDRTQLSENVHKKLWKALHDFDKHHFSPVADGVATFFLSFHGLNDISREEFDMLLEVLSQTYKKFEDAREK